MPHRNLRLAEYALPPLAYARVIRSWVGYEARAPDILPLAGEIPGFENAYVLGAVLGGYTIGPISVFCWATRFSARSKSPARS